MSIDRCGIHGWAAVVLCACVTISISLTCAGCGPGNPLDRRAVSGKISMNGTPLNNGNIRFVPRGPGGVSTGAVINAGGEYRIVETQGLPPGKYRVEIYSNDESNEKSSLVATSGTAGSMPPPGIERIPPKYNLQSTLTVEMTPSGPTQFDFDLKSE
jgi:hypothetical protein